MAATVSSSPWGAKPSVGSWALDAEENEAELQQQQQQQQQKQDDGPADFPSLTAAVATKSKKKKGQTISLAEFSTYSAPAPPKSTFQPSFQSKGLTHEDMLALPTGPRERTAEELDRSRLGGGFRSYGLSGGRGRDGEDSSNSRWGSNSRGSDDSRRNGGGGFGRDSGSDMGPSRADEIDDWGAGKKSMVSNGFERKERGGGGGGGFFDSQSKADESDNWGSNKSFAPTEGRRFGGGGGGGGFDRERRGGFESNTNGGGADSESWGRKREEGGGISNGSGRSSSYTNGGGADSDLWAKKKEEGGGNADGSGSGRPRLNLQPRTLPVRPVSPVSDVQQQAPHAPEIAIVIAPKPKGANPFGEARPREEVLAEKGQDWKKIDEQLESVKIKEAAIDGPGKRSFGSAKGRGSSPEDRVERSWRKPESDALPQSAEKVEIDVAEEN